MPCYFTRVCPTCFCCASYPNLFTHGVLDHEHRLEVDRYGLGSHPRSFVFLAWNAVSASYHRPPCSLAPNLLLPTPAERPSNRCKPDRHITSSRPTRSRGRTRGVKRIGIQRSPGGLDKSRKLLALEPHTTQGLVRPVGVDAGSFAIVDVPSGFRLPAGSCRGGGALRGRLSLRSRDGGVDCRREEARREGLNLR